MKLFFCDTETTDAQQPRLTWQIAYKVIDTNREIELIAPTEIFIGVDDSFFKPRALEIKKEVLASQEKPPKYRTLRQAYSKLRSDLDLVVDKYDKRDKMLFLAYNANFDDDNIRAIFNEVGDKYYGGLFYWPPIDVAMYALPHLLSVRHLMPDFKQGTVAKALGIKIDESRLHDASYDLFVLEQIWKRVEPDIPEWYNEDVFIDAVEAAMKGDQVDV